MKKNLIIIISSILGILLFSWLAFDVFGPKEDLLPTIQVNGELYYDTGCVNQSDVRSEEPDGIIASHIESYKLPTEDNQANFDEGYNHKYQFGAIDGTIEVYIETHDHWLIFATEEVKENYDFNQYMNIPHDKK